MKSLKIGFFTDNWLLTNSPKNKARASVYMCPPRPSSHLVPDPEAAGRHRFVQVSEKQQSRAMVAEWVETPHPLMSCPPPRPPMPSVTLPAFAQTAPRACLAPSGCASRQRSLPLQSGWSRRSGPLCALCPFSEVDVMSWTLSAHLCSQNTQPRFGGGGEGLAYVWTVKYWPAG